MSESGQPPSDKDNNMPQAAEVGAWTVRTMHDEANARRLKRFVEDQKAKHGKRPEVSPEHKKVFKSIYARLFKYAREKGEPSRVLMETSEGGNDYITVGDPKKDPLMPNLGDAYGAELFLERDTVYERRARVTLFGEEAVHATQGTLGWLNDLKPTFMRDDNGIDQERYTFYSDGNILFEQFADPNRHESRGEYPIDSKWLAGQEIEALAAKIDFDE